MIFKVDKVKAHCDIPCKIYDPYISQYATLSVIRLLDLIFELSNDSQTDQNAQLSRLVNQKEVHAKEVKDSISTIWGDYFKEPQIEKFPQIHEITHKIMLLSSACKQGNDRKNGEKLLEQINEFSRIFWETKGVQTKQVITPYPPSLAITQPVLKDA